MDFMPTEIIFHIMLFLNIKEIDLKIALISKNFY